MKNKIYIVIIIFLLLVNIFSLWNNKQSNKDNKFLKNYIERKNSRDSVLLNSIMRENIRLTKYASFKIDKNLELVNEKQDSLSLCKIPFNDKKMVFRYNEFACSDCIHKEFSVLKKYEEAIGKDNIVIFASYHSIKDLYINKRVNRLDMDVYNLKLGTLDNEMDKYNIPYIFVYDKNYNVSNLFIPNKDSPKMTEIYLKNIVKLFNSKE